ncbi:MAG: Fe-S-cluster-containing hydrogenase component 2, partial [Acidobacteria bacterium]|nr:Fe-S-cluster-containing hydrogenase component 2 [Acidobacteriota bacterium]
MIFDLIIVGSGPAGLAAASHAKANGLTYALLERTSHLADTIDSYQARKYVMAEPMMIPARGEVPFQAGSRESILDAWRRHVEERKLDVRFKAEVKTLKKDGDRFLIKTAAGEEFDARSVILGMGTQGNPRKLGTPGDDLPHVRYRLVDPAEHEDQDILVVG